MADFRPFRGLVPSLSEGEKIGGRISPPYDVIDDAQRKELQSHRHNIARITLRGANGSYRGAAKELKDWIATKALVADDKECFYAYRQTFDDGGVQVTRTGIIGRLRVEPYGKNVLPHEETSARVKQDRLSLLRAIQTHPESIFCIYERSDPDALSGLDRATPLFEHLDDSGVRHSFARVTDEHTIDAVSEMLSDQRLLIADGHHRYETALRYSEENPEDEEKAYVLATLVATDDPGLLVRPTHRLYEAGGFSSDFFLSLAAKEFLMWEALSVEEMDKFMLRSSRMTLGFLLKDGRMFVGESLVPTSDDPLDSLDTRVCEGVVYKKMLVPLAEKGNVKIDYDHDLLSVRRKMESGDWDLAVILSSPRMETIWDVAKLGEKMPRKSTFFWPKVWSGFVLYPMK